MWLIVSFLLSNACWSMASDIVGTPGRDRLVGTSGDDTVIAYGGLDTIDAGLGSDDISTGAGADRVYAADGVADSINPGKGYSNDNQNKDAELLFVDAVDKINFPKPDKGSAYTTKAITLSWKGKTYTGTEYFGGGKKRYRVFIVDPKDNPRLEDSGRAADGGLVQGDPHFTGYDGSKYDFHGYDGGVFNIFTEAIHQINAQFVDYGQDIYEGTWMNGFGIRYGTKFTLSCWMKMPSDYKAEQVYDEEGEVRMIPPSENFIVVEHNGDRRATDKLYTGTSIQQAADGVLVYYPPITAKNEEEAWDGPFLVIRTTDMEITLLLETEGVLHFDLNVKLLSGEFSELHGVLGQSANWKDGNHTSVEGEESDYAVKGGLVGTDFKYNLFRGQRVAQHGHRRLIERSTKKFEKYVGKSCGIQ